MPRPSDWRARIVRVVAQTRTYLREHQRLGVAMLAVVVLAAIGLGGGLLGGSTATSGAPAPSAGPSPALPTAGPRLGPFRVLRVVDGATLLIEEKPGRARTVRLVGIDAPVLADQGLQSNCLAVAATRALASLVRGGEVDLVIDAPAAIGDRQFGQNGADDEVRQLAYVYVGRLLVNRKLLEGGFVDQYAERPYRLEADFRTAEQTARRQGLGVWSPGSCTMPAG